MIFAQMSLVPRAHSFSSCCISQWLDPFSLISQLFETLRLCLLLVPSSFTRENLKLCFPLILNSSVICSYITGFLLAHGILGIDVTFYMIGPSGRELTRWEHILESPL